MPTYRYRVSGTARAHQTWTTTGRVVSTNLGEFPQMVNQALRDSFQQLTEGTAVYGSPEQSCQGPYTITRFEIEQMEGA